MAAALPTQYRCVKLRPKDTLGHKKPTDLTEVGAALLMEVLRLRGRVCYSGYPKNNANNLIFALRFFPFAQLGS